MQRFFKPIILLLFLTTLQAMGQTKSVQMLEGEIRAGLTTPLGGYHDGKSQVSATLGLEGRYNFKGTPWDCGLMLVNSLQRL